MSNFTIKQSPLQHPVFVTLEETLAGQVDIMVEDVDGLTHRICSLSDGKLCLFRVDGNLAREIGLNLDQGYYPSIEYVGLPD